ncbi:GTPase-activating protein gyp1 [Cyberlindnera fabianii]|uniref:GTPase-activating protein gyp1 n=2 Tax=Cyberlindnera fabianii TaxID=36022 RepID=A0A1V2LED8_CYBFA|nr:GTPase-activating protein gyp1 [Cyberlindnera fabianii]
MTCVEKGQVPKHQNEFTFDEGGGRPQGHHSAPSFLRTLSSAFKEKKSVVAVNDQVKMVGAAFSHLGMSNDSSSTVSLSSTTKKSSKSKKKEPKSPKRKDSNISTPRESIQYTDLDDDWDADVENGLKTVDSAPRFMENKMTFDYPTIKGMSDGSGVKNHVDGIVKDPANSLYTMHEPNLRLEKESTKELEELNAAISRFNRFKTVLQEPNVDLEKLRKMAWNGIPDELRPISWQLLVGYLPTNSDRRVSQLQRKRQEYLNGIKEEFGREKEAQTWHQIEIDIPRTNPHIKLYGYETTQRSLERLLYLWSVRHPASGYVQGINDLATPFFQTFLSAYIGADTDVLTFDPGTLPTDVIEAIEADTFWCLTKLLEGIQDNYIHAQPGIIRQVNGLKDLINRIDADLYTHLENENVEFIQFSFRWMNCLLMREISIQSTIRMWDTYLSETNGFSEFHVYVCAAFLVKWSEKLKQMDFQEIMMFLQDPPTKQWTEKDIELLLSEAFIWQSLYKNASAHLRS